MNHSLEISRDEFAAAFKLIRKLCKPRRDEEAVLSYDGQCLHIELGGMSVTPKATGTWPGQARVPGSFILSFTKLLPPGDPIRLRVEDGRLHIGSSSIACQWQAPWSKQIELPMNPTMGDYLALRFQYTQKEIAQSGLAESVQNAEEWADRKLAKIAEQLKDFNVTAAELRDFIDTHLKKKLNHP